MGIGVDGVRCIMVWIRGGCCGWLNWLETRVQGWCECLGLGMNAGDMVIGMGGFGDCYEGSVGFRV